MRHIPRIDVFQSAYAHVMGSTAYEAMAGALPTADHPFSGIMNAARKLAFSRTLQTAEWAGTVIASGDTTEEVGKLRRRPSRPSDRRAFGRLCDVSEMLVVDR